MSIVAIALVLSPAAALAQDEVVYYHTDAIGSVRMVTDATGAVVARCDYLPFGVIWPTSPPNASPDVRQFAGKERDTETGLDYFGARYHMSTTGRFTTVDPALDIQKAQLEPQLWNRYTYVTNNPFRFQDPDGRQRAELMLDQDIRALAAGQITREEYNARIQARGAGALMGVAIATGPIAWRGAVGCLLSPSCQSMAIETIEGSAGGPLTGAASAAARINVTERGLGHVLARHVDGGALSAGKSLFSGGVTEVQSLIRAAEGVAPTLQKGGNLQRVVDAGRVIGIDRATGQPTSVYSVITNKAGELVTAFPGLR